VSPPADAPAKDQKRNAWILLGLIVGALIVLNQNAARGSQSDETIVDTGALTPSSGPSRACG
jgi:hypothetical protein